MLLLICWSVMEEQRQKQSFSELNGWNHLFQASLSSVNLFFWFFSGARNVFLLKAGSLIVKRTNNRKYSLNGSKFLFIVVKREACQAQRFCFKNSRTSPREPMSESLIYGIIKTVSNLFRKMISLRICTWYICLDINFIWNSISK